MKTNFHTHTQRCRHAQGCAEDYLRAALDSDLSVLGFSDHAPFPDFDYGYRMLFSELEDYIAEVAQLKQDYAGKISLYTGLEIEYLPQYESYYEDLKGKYHMDYLLLGEHFFVDSHKEIFNITTGAPSTEKYLEYADAVAQALKTGFFDAVAHPDIFTMSPLSWDRNCDAATDRILEAAARSGVVLEYNANGLRRGLKEYPDGERYMYPHENFWLRAAKSGLPVVVGSDCHNPTQMWDSCMDAALENLKRYGITPTPLLKFCKEAR